MNGRVRHPWIIDVEASGFGAESYPIEIGLAMERGEHYCSLIRPVPGWTHWCREAESYHRVSRRLLFEQGKPIREVAREVNRLLYRRTVYSDGWVVDRPWLIKLFYQAGMEMAFRISPLEMILSEAQMAIWHSTKRQVAEALDMHRHRARNDAQIIQQTYRRTLEQSNPDAASRSTNP